MTYLVIFIATALISIVLLVRWTFGSGDKMPIRAELAAVSVDELRPPSSATIAGIFEQSDWQFICESAPDLSEAFLNERKRLALLWVMHARGRASKAMQIHRVAVRENAELRAGKEMKLAAEYWQLWCLYSLLQLMIATRGPFKAQRMARFVSESAGRFWKASDSVFVPLKDSLHPQGIRYLRN